jgi:large subunit ribosomal protein L12
MEYIYAALMLHKLKKEVNEENIKKMFNSIGSDSDEIRVKALVAALKEVNIEEAIKTPTFAQTVSVPQAAPSTAPAKAEAKEAKEGKAEEAAKEEEALSGLSSLFG